MEKHEVAIVGAGPGGLTAAKELAFKDKDVLVLEKKAEDEITRNKPDTAFVLWASEGENIFPESVYDCVVPVAGDIHGVEYTFDIFPLVKDGMIILNRKKLCWWQLKEAKRFGVEIRDQSPVLKIKRKDNKVILRDGAEIGYDYLIGADGGWSLVKKSLGIKERHPMWGVSYIIDDDTGTFIDHYYPDWWSTRDVCGASQTEQVGWSI
jgi:flavin-dependent dehydrogenase